MSNYSSPISRSQKQTPNPKSSNLLNILHNELLKPSNSPSLSTKHQSIQCSFNDIQCSPNENDVILIGHSTNEIIQKILPIRPGLNECGIQVDFNETNLDLLINLYSNRLPIELIEQFYEICHFDYTWTCEQIGEYLRNHSEQQTIPSLRQLTLEKLNQWNEEIKQTNPLFNMNSMNDLLEDINDDDTFEDIESNQITIPWSILNSLEDLYGDLPNKSSLMSNNHGLLMTCDDELMRNIYQALQRYLFDKPVIIKENSRKNLVDNQKWKPTVNKQSKDSIPSLRQIMEEEQHAMKCQKSKPKQQLDYASEHKLKELQRHFPLIDSELLLDIFRENEYDYDITYICLSTMFDENVSIPVRPKFSSPSPSPSRTRIEPVVESYDDLRCDALRHAQNRKEFYAKAQQANRHGMSGVASFYIHRACEETQMMKDANRLACDRLSRWRLEQFNQTQRLDLHGLHSDEALDLFKRVEREFNEKTRRTTLKSIEIITGYGKNSIYGGGHGKIRSMILTYLQQRNYKYSEPNKGVILLQL